MIRSFTPTLLQLYISLLQIRTVLEFGDILLTYLVGEFLLSTLTTFSLKCGACEGSRSLLQTQTQHSSNDNKKLTFSAPLKKPINNELVCWSGAGFAWPICFLHPTVIRCCCLSVPSFIFAQLKRQIFLGGVIVGNIWALWLHRGVSRFSRSSCSMNISSVIRSFSGSRRL